MGPTVLICVSTACRYDFLVDGSVGGLALLVLRPMLLCMCCMLRLCICFRLRVLHMLHCLVVCCKVPGLSVLAGCIVLHVWMSFACCLVKLPLAAFHAAL